MVVDAVEIRDIQSLHLLWCYLVSLRGQLYAIADEEQAVLLPHIGPLPHVTPLPSGLVRPYVLGVVNVNQRGEVLIDLASYLGLSGDPTPEEERRLLVVSENIGDRAAELAAHDIYHLAFAVDAGHELTQIELTQEDAGHGETFVRALVDTPRGPATLLNMERLCRSIVADLGADRPWNAPVETHE